MTKARKKVHPWDRWPERMASLRTFLANYSDDQGKLDDAYELLRGMPKAQRRIPKPNSISAGKAQTINELRKFAHAIAELSQPLANLQQLLDSMHRQASSAISPLNEEDASTTISQLLALEHRAQWAIVSYKAGEGSFRSRGGFSDGYVQLKSLKAAQAFHLLTGEIPPISETGDWPDFLHQIFDILGIASEVESYAKPAATQFRERIASQTSPLN